jgi:hypothetical protein
MCQLTVNRALRRLDNVKVFSSATPISDSSGIPDGNESCRLTLGLLVRLDFLHTLYNFVNISPTQSGHSLTDIS